MRRWIFPSAFDPVVCWYLLFKCGVMFSNFFLAATSHLFTSLFEVVPCCLCDWLLIFAVLTSCRCSLTSRDSLFSNFTVICWLAVCDRNALISRMFRAHFLEFFFYLKHFAKNPLMRQGDLKFKTFRFSRLLFDNEILLQSVRNSIPSKYSH